MHRALEMQPPLLLCSQRRMRGTQKLKHHWHNGCGDNLRQIPVFGRSLQTIWSEMCADKAWRSPTRLAKVKEVQFSMKETSYQQTQYAQMADKELLSAKAQAYEGTLGLIAGLSADLQKSQSKRVSTWHRSVKPDMASSYVQPINFKCRKRKISSSSSWRNVNVMSSRSSSSWQAASPSRGWLSQGSGSSLPSSSASSTWSAQL